MVHSLSRTPNTQVLQSNCMNRSHFEQVNKKEADLQLLDFGQDSHKRVPCPLGFFVFHLLDLKVTKNLRQIVKKVTSLPFYSIPKTPVINKSFINNLL